LAIIEFARRLWIQNGHLDGKVKKLLKPYITEDFGKFNTCDFVNRLKEWGKFNGDKHKNTNPNVNANEAKKDAFHEKLNKAKKEGKCVHCQQKSCIEEKQNQDTAEIDKNSLQKKAY
jgi:hypothetical protein